MGMIVYLLLMSGGVASAQDADPVARAKELFENGTLLYDEGSYEAAVAAFREAWELSGEPLLLFNMASALERLGEWEEAIDALDGYRAFAPADEREVLERRIRALEGRAADKRAAEAAAAKQIAPPPPAPVVAARRGPKPLQLALFGVGAAGVGAGATFSALALSSRGEWTGRCVEADAGLLCPSAAGEGARRDRARSIMADVSWGVGLLALGGGVVVSLGGGRSSDLAVGVGPDGVSVGGRW